ncbi:oligoendopeptidase F [Lentilactobacillus hilgardii]|uniref:Oligopeptidase F n=3 Tax=Lentilactobacillus hilgardii TaxID=1588 RepID=A0A6P1E562_LENHI|nr:oligoendopeptidase F [Lentilactobacillus hilgardii ATCC 27305]MCT3391168.1 oligoendopeptidase F [Lentilactobacillus hilgardii]QHB51699.1 oligoendopeptidase F [Lentilactobacillus hilgardii]RRG07666.1 MAG: oligoendopeptidase F [Lactobacillus sp.]
MTNMKGCNEMSETQKLPLRKDVPADLTWDLTTIYQSDDQFEKDFVSVEKTLPSLKKLSGTLTQGAAALLTATETMLTAARKLEKVYVYAQLKNDQDTSEDGYQAMYAKAQALAAQFGAATAWFDPELLKLNDKQMTSYYEAQPKLRDYKRLYDQTFAKRAHILSNEVEEVLAGADDIFSSGEKTFGVLDNTDLSFPTVTDENGHQVQLSQGVYGILLESTNRDVRRQAFQKLYEVYSQFQHTLAATLTTNVKNHNFKANVRQYHSALEAALSSTEIPVKVYDNLISEVNKHLDLLHRYVALRKRILGLDELHMYDLYTPLIGEKSPKYTFDESKKVALDALQVMGPQYVNHVKEEFNNRWIDVVENRYKRSGGYSSGTYDTNPFILLNWKDNLDNLYTLIHETGHSMHSYYASHNQPYQYGDYSIFVAEIASTTNENILTDYLLDKFKDDDKMKRYILNYYLDGFKGTVFRQTQFAEFEQYIHEQDAKGQPLTANFLDNYYRQLNQKYYGESVISDKEIGLEWSRIPHFYYNFYVYQYATGFAAASTLADNIVNGDAEHVEKYLNYLKSGSSDTPINVMKKAGVDMTQPEYLEKAFRIFEERLDEFEKLF